MSINNLKSFFNYQAITDSNPQFVVDQIKKTAGEYLNAEELAQVQTTYEYARKAHEGQIRQSGEYYISHIVQATRFLMIIRPDLETIKGCLLHDVIEDCDISADEIEKEFGPVVRKLCEGVTKVSTIKYRGEERQIETIKKTFFAMSEDLRVIFIKLADRVHNIQTLHFHPKVEKQMRIVNETLEIYVPIAEKLGLTAYQYLLENGCFHISHPQECTQVIDYLSKPIYNKASEKGVGIITKVLEKEGMKDFEVKGRVKSPRSVFKKLTQKHGSADISSIAGINDLVGFRIIVDTVPSCYLAMGILHNMYTPLVHKIKDYIVVPKPNGYQSIHSIILGLFAFPVEIQIRTEEMDQYAEFGVAAHFAYKEVGYDKQKMQSFRADSRQTQWVGKLQEIVKEYQDDNEGFKQEMKIELLDDTIFTYTPKGDIIELKKGSTILDFAFRIHSEVGLRYRAGLVNGSIVPLDFQLKTGDIVNITTRKNQYSATQSRIYLLQTAGARNQVSKFLKTKIRDKLLTQSIDNLNARLVEEKLPLFKSADCLIWKKYEKKEEELEGKLIEMLDKGGYGSFINIFYKISQKHTAKPVDVSDLKTAEKHNIIIDEQNDLDFVLCPECINSTNPQIIAKSGRNGLKIHHIGCKALRTVSYEKLISAHYKDEDPSIYHFSLTLELNNEPGILHKILELLTNYNLNIKNISFLESTGDMTIGNITIDIGNPGKLNFVIKDLEKSKIFTIVEKKFV